MMTWQMMSYPTEFVAMLPATLLAILIASRFARPTIAGVETQASVCQLTTPNPSYFLLLTS